MSVYLKLAGNSLTPLTSNSEQLRDIPCLGGCIRVGNQL